MKCRIVELMVCPYCDSPVELEIFKKEKNNFKINADLYCNNFCHYYNKNLTRPVEKIDCNECFNTEISEGILKCNKCERVYPVINGIPRVLKDEYLKNLQGNYDAFFNEHKNEFNKAMSGIEEDEEIIDVKKRTSTAFAREWLDFNKIHKEYEQQFLTFIAPVKPEFFKGKLVLDGGCGSGRHVYYSALYGAEAVGIDFSEAVETAYKNTRDLPFTHIIQADIYNIPFRKETFDFVYSVGVLHHLPYPEVAFTNLIDYVKKGGHIFAWVYGYENNSKILYFVNLFRKNVTTKLPLPATKKISFLLAIPFHIILKMVYRPLNSVNKSLAEKILPINQHFYQLSSFTFNHNYSIVFDHLLAPIAFYYKEQEFKKWFIDAKLKNININWCRKNSWGGLGEK